MDLIAKMLRRCGPLCCLLPRCFLSITLVLIFYFCFNLVSNKNILKYAEFMAETTDVKTFSDNILLKDRNGHIILNKSVKHLWQQPLKKWNYQNEMLMVIHVPKSSGTSFRTSLTHSRHKDGCDLKCKPRYEPVQNRTCPSTLYSWCKLHFDWTQVETVGKLWDKNSTNSNTKRSN